ncbi:RDD family protein [Pseudoxanthomonas sp. LjRoot125]|uniref:RDD family protein n=1 Tax=Pseudoxanthomonas sp. LjRoot125 TaxID=3342258 RepID=UPI003E1132B5
MTHWYYADAGGQRQGPFTADELAAHARNGRLTAESLVWRDGLDDWQPFGNFASELDVPVTALPPMEPVAEEAPDPAHVPYAPPSAQLTSTHSFVAGGRVVQAGLWKRFAASFIDNIVTTVMSYALIVPLMLLGVSVMGAGGGDNAMATGAGVAAILAMYPILILAPCVYFGWMQSSSMQASLGKLAVGIKVVRTSGERAGFWRNFLRALAYVMFSAVTCGLGVLISALMVAFTERKQALHDMMCDTLVVDKWAFTAHPERQREDLGTVTIVILVLAAVVIVGAIAMYAVMGAMMLGNLPS